MTGIPQILTHSYLQTLVATALKTKYTIIVIPVVLGARVTDGGMTLSL